MVGDGAVIAEAFSRALPRCSWWCFAEGADHGVGIHGSAVEELHPTAEAEGTRLEVRRAGPGLGQPGLQLALAVEAGEGLADDIRVPFGSRLSGEGCVPGRRSQQSQAVEADDHGGPLVAGDAQRQRQLGEQVERHQHDDGCAGEEQVLQDRPTGSAGEVDDDGQVASSSRTTTA